MRTFSLLRSSRIKVGVIRSKYIWFNLEWNNYMPNTICKDIFSRRNVQLHPASPLRTMNESVPKCPVRRVGMATKYSWVPIKRTVYFKRLGGKKVWKSRSQNRGSINKKWKNCAYFKRWIPTCKGDIMLGKKESLIGAQEYTSN